MNLLVFLEDPGAANMVVGLADALAHRGMTATFLVEPKLEDYLAQRGVPARVRDPGARAEDWMRGIDALAVGTSENIDTFAHRLVAAARIAGVPSAGLVDSPVYADRRFRGIASDPLAHCPDALLLPDVRSVSAYRALGCAAERLHLCGHPLYDFVRRRRTELAGIDRPALRERLVPGIGGRSLLLFLAAPVDGFDRESSYRRDGYTLAGRGGSGFRTLVALEEVLDAARLDPRGPAVAVRLHPKSDPTDFAGCRDELAAMMQGGDAHENVWAADAVVGMPTMLLLEALLLGRPSLGVLPSPQEVANLPALEDGIVPAVWLRDELRARLPRLADEAVDTDSLDANFPPAAADRMAAAISALAVRRPIGKRPPQAST